MSPPNFFNLQGNYYEGFLFDHGPSPLGSVINVLPSSTQQNDPNYAENLIQGAEATVISIISTFLTPQSTFLQQRRDRIIGRQPIPSTVLSPSTMRLRCPRARRLGGQTPAPLTSPAFTGSPTAPTAAPGTNTTQIATMAALHAGLQRIVVPSAYPTSSQQIRSSLPWRDFRTIFKTRLP